MAEWHEYEPPDPNHPCTGCQTGWGSYSHKVEDGKHFFKSESCTETCERLKNYHPVQWAQERSGNETNRTSIRGSTGEGPLVC